MNARAYKVTAFDGKTAIIFPSSPGGLDIGDLSDLISDYETLDPVHGEALVAINHYLEGSGFKLTKEENV